MSYHVRVERSFTPFTHRIWLARHYEDESKFRLFTNGQSWPDVEVPSGSPLPPEAYFCDIPDDAVHQVLGELARALGAVEHPEQLRRDFERLRDRHDKLVDHLIDEAKSASTIAYTRAVKR